MERGLTKECCTIKDEWDERAPIVLWDYKTSTKKLHKYTLFQLVYGREAFVPTKLITPNLYIAQVTHMTDDESVVERITELLALGKAQFLAYFYQTLEKDLDKRLSMT
jgi:hypothetical protein